MKLLKAQLFAGIFLSMGLSFSAQAKKPAASAKPKVCSELGSDLPFLVGKKIQITDYHRSTDTYDVIAKDFPSESVASVSPEGLAVGVAKVRENFAAIRKNPEDIITNPSDFYVTDKEVPVLSDEETEARKVCGTK